MLYALLQRFPDLFALHRHPIADIRRHLLRASPEYRPRAGSGRGRAFLPRRGVMSAAYSPHFSVLIFLTSLKWVLFREWFQPSCASRIGLSQNTVPFSDAANGSTRSRRCVIISASRLRERRPGALYTTSLAYAS